MLKVIGKCQQFYLFFEGGRVRFTILGFPFSVRKDMAIISWESFTLPGKLKASPFGNNLET